jgi:two-component system C4-dicarboxylate transport sensor histidine kinase DctB
MVSRVPLPLPQNEIVHLSRLITIGELSACFAHEVSSPLTLIRGHLRLLDEGISRDNPIRSNLDVIERASRRIEEMADRMLDFSRKRSPQTESCDPADLVEDAFSFLQPYLHMQQIDVQVNIPELLPPVNVDRWEIVQAMVNIMQNAVEAMSDSTRRVLRVSSVHDSSGVRISIADTGAGIRAADLPLIFSPFFTTKGPNGTGLGLYIAKRVIEEYGGNLTVQTSASGSIFTISLPDDDRLPA